MERFKLSDKAIQQLNEDINRIYLVADSKTATEAKAVIYEALAEAAINSMCYLSGEDSHVAYSIGNALYHAKIIIDDVFME